MDSNERREEERVMAENEFHFTKVHLDKMSEHSLKGSMVDYSVAGLRFVTAEPLEKNTSLLIQLDLDALDGDGVDWKTLWETGDAASLNIIGSVMWCLESKLESKVFEVGMRFTQKAVEQ